MSSHITQIASDLNEQVGNRYALVLEIAELAKKLLDDAREKRMNDPFGTELESAPDKVIYQALLMKASEIDIGDGLIG
jgi:DNA-directed RNA polymerase subunit K/omega